MSADDVDAFVGVLAYGEGRVGVLVAGAVEVRAEAEEEADSSLRLAEEPAAPVAAALRECLDGPMFTGSADEVGVLLLLRY